MFKISKLTFYKNAGQTYTYTFEESINYFKGKNDTGKTEFYSFIDFMFGSSEEITDKRWFEDTFIKADMTVIFNKTTFVMTRTKEMNVNYLHYSDEEPGEILNLKDYKNKLNSIFSQDVQSLKSIRKFTNEELTYRTFTMFNFLGEKGQGKIQDFLDKCSDIKYSVKLNPILNFIFNNNLEKIYELQNELERLQNEITELEGESQKYTFIIDQVNNNLKKLGGNIWYTGENSSDIKEYINSLIEMEKVEKKTNQRNIADLEVMYNNISEQIKVYENNNLDIKQFRKDNANRQKLLQKLQELMYENDNFEYLVQPMEHLLKEVDNTIHFSDYLISDRTILELKKQLEQIKVEIGRNDARFKLYKLEEKSRAIALIKEYLSMKTIENVGDIEENKKRVRQIKNDLKVLRNSDDIQKIDEISKFITRLYQSAKDVSSVVSEDTKKAGFEIKYLKKGNILQPMILTKDDESKNTKQVNYYIGSMARHTLIQFCGYLAFLNILLENKNYPIIPILVIDHISKPFDPKNSRAIGTILSSAYEVIGKENLQTFIFDDKDFEALCIEPEHVENLVTEYKTGFNPFYTPDALEEKQ